MRIVYFLVSATTLLFSVSNAAGTKTKCANIVAESLQTHQPFTFYVNSGGEFEAASSAVGEGESLTSSKTPNETKFVRKYAETPQYNQTITLNKSEGRFKKGTLSRLCLDGDVNNICTSTVSLDEDCNLDQKIDGSDILYDRQACSNILKAYNKASDGFTGTGGTDLKSKMQKILDSRQAAIKVEMDNTKLQFPRYYNQFEDIIMNCTNQINLENEYDGKINKFVDSSKEWFYEASNSVSEKARSATKGVMDVIKSSGGTQ
ncbi:MAG: hypothetical protein J7501_06730 [Bdellovibrio sp.]|nr:hypothetical protein [Bdellovibrio sp.]